MTEWTQIGIFAINVAIAFGGGVLWQKVRGHDQSLERGRQRMESIDNKLDKLIVQVAKLNGGK
ncbi:unnamed protein product [marine sediment metagenome]|uniref:Uncharacterized protein n=1 Tax=marine sediment metagenome TaxID=412755 RepID=X0WSY1_9ZZZZ